MTEVRTELASLASDFETEYAATHFGWTMDAYNLRSDIPDSQSRQLFLLLQGSVMFVLLIALANITNLLLARSQDRQREIALRTVLGAGRFRIVRQLMTESLMIVLLGGVAGLALGFVGIRMLTNAFAGQLPSIYSPSLDATVVLFTLGLTVSAGLLFGLMPALQTFRRSHAGVLREGGDRGASAGGKKRLVPLKRQNNTAEKRHCKTLQKVDAGSGIKVVQRAAGLVPDRQSLAAVEECGFITSLSRVS